MIKSGFLAPLLIAAGIGGAVGYKMGQSAAPPVAGEAPVEKEYSDVVSKLKTLNDEDFAEYMKLKDQKDKLDKANDILAKMIQIFLYDLATRMKMTDTQINERKEFLNAKPEASTQPNRRNEVAKSDVASPSSVADTTVATGTDAVAAAQGSIPAPEAKKASLFNSKIQYAAVNAQRVSQLGIRRGRQSLGSINNFAGKLNRLQRSGNAVILNESPADLTKRRFARSGATYLSNSIGLVLSRVDGEDQKPQGVNYAVTTENAEKVRNSLTGYMDLQRVRGEARTAVIDTGLKAKIKDVDHQIFIFITPN